MSRVIDQQYELVAVSSLTPHPDNPRKGNAQEIARSIQTNGFYGAVVAQRSTGYILAGNHRYLAATNEGLKKLPVIWVEVTDEQARKILAADNRLSDVGTYDDEALTALLTRIQAESTLEGTGYSQEAFDAIVKSAGDAILSATGLGASDSPRVPSEPMPVAVDGEDDAPTPVEGPTATQPGELWILGNHRLLCGDSTKLEDVRRLAAGAKVQLVFTDPPYNVDYEGYTEEKLTIKGDSMSADQFKAFLAAVFVSYRDIVDTTGSMYVCHPSIYQREFQDAMEAAGFDLRCQIIWAKNTFGWGFSRYKFQHEPIFYSHIKGKSDKWYGDKSQSTLWQEKKPAANRLHPTMKPVELVHRALVNSSQPGDVVADLFGGSGTTMIACEGMNRKAILMELDPKYCDVIVKRWQEFSGKKAVLDGTAEEFDSRVAAQG